MAPLRQQHRCRRRTSAGLAVLIAFFLALPVARAGTPDSEPVPLQLDVRVNGYTLNLIAAFSQMPDGRLASTRSELTELGVAVPGEGPPDEVIVLDSLPGVSYVYDESSQAIELELPDAARLARDLTPSDGPELLEAQSGTGLVLNYTAFAAADYDIPATQGGINGGSLNLDARGFSRYGTLRQTGIVGTTTFADMTAVRLDTVWSYSDQSAMRTYRLGDVVSGGLNWTRPIRIGGGQIQRNFDLRPDLITMPLPEFDGTAAVPSTLDVYIGGVKAYSQEVQPGPFRLDGFPVFTQSGTARLVLTDATGRQTESESEFYTSPDLLKKDLFDYSVDVGLARLDFGSDSFGYADQPVGLASLRYGLSNSFTGEAHVEASPDLIEGGVGGLFSAGPFGTISAAVAGSSHDGEQGLFGYAGWEVQFGDFGIQASTTRTFGNFFDLAATTARPDKNTPDLGTVPRAVDQISLTYSLRDMDAGVGLSFIHQEKASGEESFIVSGTYAQTFGNNLSFYVSGFADFGDEGDYGAFAGLSMPLGETVSTSAGLDVSKKGWTAAAEASRPLEESPGSYGWRVSHGEGGQRYTMASGAYRTSKATLEGHVSQSDDTLRADIALDGAAVLAGGGMFFGNHINDAFAVVDAGAPNVDVKYENRFAGTTDASGKLLLPQLRAYEKNKIAIDVTGLPLNAEVPESETIVVPREMSGVVVDFGVNRDSQAALVILTDETGAYLPEGSNVILDGTEEPFIMGYDGQVYLTGIGSDNALTVKRDGKECRASFAYEAQSETQTSVGPLKCL